ncbi:LysR family transcriptional regulator [Sulfitobacter sp.]|uniref:LysR family transcriptional regulator n=1 Tax=Sulfitobacter sp. TaxID=1903071 RepID=UPI003002A3AD
MKIEANTQRDVHQRLARHLDWNLLRTFIAVVECGGFSKAAQHIHLTQPAISHALKRLEQSLGLKLIERNARRFDVTDAGKIVYAKAIEIHSQISRLAEVPLPGDQQVYGHLRLLFASRLQSAILNSLLQQFHLKYPEITLSVDVLSSAEIQSRIERGLGTVGLCLMRDSPRKLRSIPIISQRYGLYCGPSHKLFQRSGVAASDLRHEDFITFPSDQIGGVLSPLAIFREQHLYRGRVVATSNNLEEIIRLTEIGIGVGLVPMHIGSDFVKEDRLFALPPLDGISPIDVHFIWNSEVNITKAEDVFIDYALKFLAKAAD